MPKQSERYRSKALLSERNAKTAPDVATREAWTEIAIEWHTLAGKTAAGGHDLEIS